MPPKKKRSSASIVQASPAPRRRPSRSNPPVTSETVPAPSTVTTSLPVIPRSPLSTTRRTSSRLAAAISHVEVCPDIADGVDALRPSPDAEGDDHFSPPSTSNEPTESELSYVDEEIEVPAPKRRKPARNTAKKASAAIEEVAAGFELGDEEGATAEEACLNTYLRTANPPVFSSRTCRIASIIEHRHPLADPTQPEHPTKNRPDKSQPASIERGQKYVEAIGLANARDIIKMVRWNDKYNIKFMRLSSEMFPFASHGEYGYKLAPFASETLAEVGGVIASLGHRVSTHPGQFTQLGSPRKVVVENAIRDLEYHDEMLSLLRLPEQLDRDAIMVLHMGGMFGDKQATLGRFRENYARLSPGVKKRLVLENDDVGWSIHDLLPICQELNIPLVLDYHHHNIVFDNTQVREGTLDIMNLYDDIAKTWKRKGITQKMHYSEPAPGAITARQRRKHSPRVMTLPPCDPTMDLMIEAKDKEQAVLELMRTFKLPGFEKIGDIIPHQRGDESRPARPPRKLTKKQRALGNGDTDIDLGIPAVIVSEEERGMGGPDGRVYWPPGMEEWLRPAKRV
ncbi:related to UV-damage endonuclease [Cephalotrichum gorgonifer]|uniref:Related to UV-damage endonuclease n=1 Tax=Cephalotrichum gorgonifer TaxID=2041049 RepID=A0AAE8MVR3_9PEZI|nr:related to UV-damage endonuclease [Cephalotrichum gorgonifer]